eukprot:TRINITY_DN3097_c0_g1_i1.p1 TRINITY_DN3097_c0_g1~~TRINITY_DN3097_c0_g1_i1.p1  ORF type:complete len:371 (+),score=58.17 TRINITY_DN3097_c0_g1_i1:300-1412(+)
MAQLVKRRGGESFRGLPNNDTNKEEIQNTHANLLSLCPYTLQEHIFGRLDKKDLLCLTRVSKNYNTLMNIVHPIFRYSHTLKMRVKSPDIQWKLHRLDAIVKNNVWFGHYHDTFFVIYVIVLFLCTIVALILSAAYAILSLFLYARILYSESFFWFYVGYEWLFGPPSKTHDDLCLIFCEAFLVPVFLLVLLVIFLSTIYWIFMIVDINEDDFGRWAEPLMKIGPLFNMKGQIKFSKKEVFKNKPRRITIKLFLMNFVWAIVVGWFFVPVTVFFAILQYATVFGFFENKFLWVAYYLLWPVGYEFSSNGSTPRIPLEVPFDDFMHAIKNELKDKRKTSIDDLAIFLKEFTEGKRQIPTEYKKQTKKWILF